MPRGKRVTTGLPATEAPKSKKVKVQAQQPPHNSPTAPTTPSKLEQWRKSVTEGTLVLAVPHKRNNGVPHIGKVIEVTKMCDGVSKPGKKIPVYIYKVTFYHPNEDYRVTNTLRIEKLMEAPTLPPPPTSAQPKTRKGIAPGEAILLKHGDYVLAKTGRGDNTKYLPAVIQSFTHSNLESKNNIVFTVYFPHSRQFSSSVRPQNMVPFYNDSHMALNKDKIGWYPTNQSAADADPVTPVTELDRVVKFYAWKDTPADQTNYKVDYSEEAKELGDKVGKDEVKVCFACRLEYLVGEGQDDEYRLCKDCLPLGW